MFFMRHACDCFACHNVGVYDYKCAVDARQLSHLEDMFNDDPVLVDVDFETLARRVMNLSRLSNTQSIELSL